LCAKFFLSAFPLSRSISGKAATSSLLSLFSVFSAFSTLSSPSSSFFSSFLAVTGAGRFSGGGGERCCGRCWQRRRRFRKISDWDSPPRSIPAKKAANQQAPSLLGASTGLPKLSVVGAADSAISLGSGSGATFDASSSGLAPGKDGTASAGTLLPPGAPASSGKGSSGGVVQTRKAEA
jgi:hypothetical protein